MSPHRIRFRPQLETCDDRLCPSSTTTLPISTFLVQQGSTSVFGGAFPDEIAWQNSAIDPGTSGVGSTSGGESVFSLLLADYTGAAAKYLSDHHINVPTKITGFVTETPVAGTGLMEVSVNLEATGAVTTVARVPQSQLNGDTSVAPVAFGYRPEEVVANPALASKLAFSNLRMQLTFMENVGQPLPDLVQSFILGNAPAGFAPERISFQSWGTGVLRDASPVGTPGQTAVASTWQVADLTNGSLPGTLADGFFQEPVDLIPLASPTSNVGYLDGTLFVFDQGGKNDAITVTPTAGGGAALNSSLGSATFTNVTRVVTALSGGNDKVTIGDLPGATVNVVAIGKGNKDIRIGDAAKGGIFVGDGNNSITAGNVAPGALFVGVSGQGNNSVTLTGNNAAEVLVSGNCNIRISAAGNGDFVEVLGNGNNQLTDTGDNVQIWLGGDGNNAIDNDGGFTTVLAGTGHNRIRGAFGPFNPPS